MFNNINNNSNNKHMEICTNNILELFPMSNNNITKVFQ